MCSLAGFIHFTNAYIFQNIMSYIINTYNFLSLKKLVLKDRPYILQIQNVPAKLEQPSPFFLQALFIGVT